MGLEPRLSAILNRGGALPRLIGGGLLLFPCAAIFPLAYKFSEGAGSDVTLVTLPGAHLINQAFGNSASPRLLRFPPPFFHPFLSPRVARFWLRNGCVRWFGQGTTCACQTFGNMRFSAAQLTHNTCTASAPKTQKRAARRPPFDLTRGNEIRSRRRSTRPACCRCGSRGPTHIRSCS